ncbi:MAG: WWE domain-containing protein [Planctomycetes bacterium]|nr:WWE domain-containing protein [Planctomycetota bacterium]
MTAHGRRSLVQPSLLLRAFRSLDMATEKGQWQVQHGSMWWDIQSDINAEIENARGAGCTEVVYTYDWGDDYAGSFGHGLSRYRLDFGALTQTNLDREKPPRKVRLIKILLS